MCRMLLQPVFAQSLAIIIALANFGLPLIAAADEPSTLLEWIAAIDRDYSADGWGQSHQRRPDGYMRELGDNGWKTRVLALQAVVKAGDKAVEPLVEALKSGSEPQRIFAAQALGYLSADAPLEPLLTAFNDDPDASVRLHAVDSIGMRGGADALDWDALSDAQSSEDVRTHIRYAVERGAEGVAPETVAALRDWDPALIDSAVVGKPAPDFELAVASGGHVRLSDFRGKQSVVLIFIYGDTCPVCHHYLASMRRGLADLRELNAEMLAVDAHDIWAARALLRETGLTTDDLNFPLLLDPSHTVSAAYGVAMQERIHTAISDRPATFIIDREGVLRYVRRAETIPDRPSVDQVAAELRKLAP